MKQITLMEAYLIETLRSNGVTEKEILQAVENREIEIFQKYNENFDFTGLYSLQEDLHKLLYEGYQVKFLTMPGLMNLLRMKHNKVQEKDFIKKETSITNLTLTSDEKEEIEKWLSANWTLNQTNDTYEIVPTYQL